MHRYLKVVLRTARSPLLNARCFSTAQEKVVIDVDSKTGIATLKMNSPPVNSLDSELLKSCTEAAKFAEKESDVRGVILKSNFEGQVFSAGLNIQDMYQKSETHLFDFWTNVQDWFIAWYGCKKPTAAVINGHAPAGGCAFAMMCDYRTMQSGDGKTIGLNETRLGITAPFFFIELMKNTVGHRQAESGLFAGRMFSAEEALKIGMVDSIGSLEDLTSMAMSELNKMMAVPLHAYTLTKMAMRQDVINRLIKVKRDDAQQFAMFVSQPKVQQAIGYYLSSLKSKKK